MMSFEVCDYGLKELFGILFSIKDGMTHEFDKCST